MVAVRAGFQVGRIPRGTFERGAQFRWKVASGASNNALERTVKHRGARLWRERQPCAGRSTRSLDRKMNGRRTLVALWLLFSPSVGAHVDRTISVQPDGSLVGLPEKYAPAILLRVNSGREQTLALQLNSNRTSLPSCVARKLRLTRAKLRTHASWYHDTSGLPPYLAVDVVHSEQRNGYFNGFTLLFNLDTSALIELTQVSAKGEEMRNTPVDLNALCATESGKAPSDAK